jgi:acyl-coenzyme A thioesterase PaaI-like protein
MENMERRVRASFDRQAIMRTLGAELLRVGAGTAEIRLPYAAFSLMPDDAAVLTIEYKINLMAPAEGEMFMARGKVLRAGKTVTVCQADVYAVGDGAEHLVATLLATVMTLRNRPGLAG